MKHEEYSRIIPGASNAVLFIHGIVGTPHHFDDFLPLVPENWSICNMLLEGHGGRVEDFGATSMKRWKAQVEDKLQYLCDSHENVFIVGHSMGTLFALQGAVDHPQQVKGVFLLASPLRVWVQPLAVLSSLRVALNMGRKSNARLQAMYEAYSIQPDWRVWKYIPWIPRYIELLAEIAATRKILRLVNASCWAFQSGKDELVSKRACRELDRIPEIRIEILQKSGHYYYEAQEKTHMLDVFGVCMCTTKEE